jgi:hypothetical protein
MNETKIGIRILKNVPAYEWPYTQSNELTTVEGPFVQHFRL